MQVNRQPLRRARDLLGALRVTVFAPDDLELVKGGPAERRRCLDDTLVALHPRNDALRTELDRVLRQRNALLKQSGGRLDAGRRVHPRRVGRQARRRRARPSPTARAALLERLAPVLAATYDAAGPAPGAGRRATYDAPWRRRGGLAAALVDARRDDLRRGVSTVGPHRDDLDLAIGGLPARTHASQGEQRSLALALRLAVAPGGHRGARHAADPAARRRVLRARPRPLRALLANLPAGQTVLTTAGALPPAPRPTPSCGCAAAPWRGRLGCDAVGRARRSRGPRRPGSNACLSHPGG